MCSETSAGSAIGTVLIENARTRVTEWRFRQKGANTGWHVHEHDYVVVPMFTGQLELHEPGGVRRLAELTAGTPYFRNAGVEHDVINANDAEVSFIEIEFLS